METVNILQKLFKQQTNILLETFTLKEGQILNGKILKLFPNQIAEVQVGSQKIIAKLEVPLSANERYWFQVQAGEGPIHLKMMNTFPEKSTSSTPERLLLEVGIPRSKEGVQLMEFALKEHLPVKSSEFHEAVVWLKELTELKPGLETIKSMMEKELPFTKSIFNTLLTVQDSEPIHLLMERVMEGISRDDQTETSQLLQKALETLINNKNINGEVNEVPDWSEGPQVSTKLKKLVHTIGLSYENEILRNGENKNLGDKENALKPLLIRYLNEHPVGRQKEVSEHLLNRITALQILSHENGTIQQFVAQIPIHFNQNNTDLTIQWNGRKKEDGKIDPNYCRVLFFLDLKSIGETFVDIQIQNRIMSILVENNRDDLKEFAHPFIHLLKENLSSMDYFLSSVNFQKPLEKREGKMMKKGPFQAFANPSYEGVDFRI